MIFASYSVVIERTAANLIAEGWKSTTKKPTQAMSWDELSLA